MESNSLRRPPLHYGSALAMIGADWLIVAVNIASVGAHFVIVDLLGGLAVLIGVATLEGEVGRVRPLHAWLKGLFCGLVVAFPLPMLGTVLGLVALIWDLTLRLRRRRTA